MSATPQPPHAPNLEPALTSSRSSDRPVEMDNLPPPAIAGTASSSTPDHAPSTDPESSQPPSEAITSARLPPTLSGSPEASMAAAGSPSAAVAEPTITITLLLPSGKRYPYTLNAKYLRKRKNVVEVQDDDPSKITVYFMKLLLMHDWKEEWAEKPQSAEKIRLIYFGRMLEDSSTLKDCKLDASAGPNVVHMSIRPPDTIEEDADPKGASRAAEDDGSHTIGGNVGPGQLSRDEAVSRAIEEEGGRPCCGCCMIM